MPRQARSAGEYLHLIVRGIGKQILFEDNSDREKYIAYLCKYAEETEVSILAYCLMENHVHLLVRDAKGSVPVFMKKMGVSFAQYYNRKYDRTGHLFQDRYRSENITDDGYLLSVYRYILNNPAKAGICDVAAYPWSSYREYGRTDGLTDTRMLVEMIGGREQFRQFMQQEDSAEHMEAERRKNDDAWALEMLQTVLHITSGTQLQQFDRQQRDEALALLREHGLSVRQLERLTGINRGVIQKARSCRSEPSLMTSELE